MAEFATRLAVGLGKKAVDIYRSGKPEYDKRRKAERAKGQSARDVMSGGATHRKIKDRGI